MPQYAYPPRSLTVCRLVLSRPGRGLRAPVTILRQMPIPSPDVECFSALQAMREIVSLLRSLEDVLMFTAFANWTGLG